MTDSLTFMGFHVPRDGYGYATIKIASALGRVSSSEFCVLCLDMRGPVGKGWGRPGDREWVVPGTVVALCTPDWLPFIHVRRLVAYTMFEATRLPDGWVEKINRYAERCLVPSAWCREVFLANGVEVPVGVVRWGVDPGDYVPMDRGERDGQPYTFLWSGTPDRRKGWDVAYRAFWRAFEGSDEARLVLHFRQAPHGLAQCNDANVRMVVGRFDRPRLRVMLRDADCFVFPSRGEGWGLPPREAAATGLPVIATDFGGLAEEIVSWGFPLRVRGMSRADYGFWGDDIGEWAEPDEEHLVELMRWCFENREKAAVLGEQAAAWTMENANWSRTARGIIEQVQGEVGQCLAVSANGAERSFPGARRRIKNGSRSIQEERCISQPAGDG